MLFASACACASSCFGQVSLTFDTGTQGVVAGGDATSVAWDATGQRLAITTAGGWKPQCAFIDFNDPLLADIKAELLLALTNGGKLSYTITVETTSLTGGAPGWFETMYIGNSSAGWDQTYGANKNQVTAYGSFPLSTPIVHTVEYDIENATSVTSDTFAQFNSTSGWLQVNLGLNSQSNYTAVTYYIDNFTVNANEVVAPVVIPKLSITPAIPGLNIVSNGGSQYDRQCVRTTTNNVSWVDGTFPVTYELTIADYPKVVGYESVIYLVPGSDIPASNSAPDYAMPVCAGLWIYSNGDGTGSMAFRYKDGVANSNGASGHEYWVADPAPSHGLGGQLASVYSSTMIGKWKITFTSNTDFTLTGPSGNTVSGTMNATTAAKFGPDLYAYFGNTPSQVANMGLHAVYSHIKISGTNGDFEENFSEIPFSAALERSAANAAGVIEVTPALAKYWLNWTLPATDFALFQCTDLGLEQDWTSIPITSAINDKFGKKLLLKNDDLVDTTKNFFQMVKP